MNNDKYVAIVSARAMINNPDRYVILDTETTGLHDCEIVQIAIIDFKGNTLLNTLVKPTCEITAGASAIHGITAADVVNSPDFETIHPLIEAATRGKIVVIYNAIFDDKVLFDCCKKNMLNYFQYESCCAMEIYSEFIGEIHPYFKTYTWQKLPGGDHTALGDCKATLEILELVAATRLEAAQLQLAEVDNDIPY